MNVLIARRGLRAWLLAAAAGFLLLFVLYADTPVGTRAPLPLLCLATLIALHRTQHLAPST